MPKKVCASVGCRNITTKRNCPKCEQRLAIRAKEFAKTRARKSKVNMTDKNRSFYGSAEWKRLRDKKLRQDPLCEDCKDNGFLREGKDIDHIIEVKDDFSRRLDITNLRTLCRSCHTHKTSRVKRQREKKV